MLIYHPGLVLGRVLVLSGTSIRYSTWYYQHAVQEGGRSQCKKRGRPQFKKGVGRSAKRGSKSHRSATGGDAAVYGVRRSVGCTPVCRGYAPMHYKDLLPERCFQDLGCRANYAEMHIFYHCLGQEADRVEMSMRLCQ